MGQGRQGSRSPAKNGYNIVTAKLDNIFLDIGKFLFLVFHTEERMDEHTRSHLHETPWVVTGPLIALAPGITKSLKPGGFVILSGILNEQADEVQAVYVKAGFNPVQREEIVDWTTLMLARNG